MVSCGAQFIKYLLFFFNLIWLALGAGILYMGFRITSFSGDLGSVVDTNMKTGAVVVLVAGFAVFLIAFLGCCGAIKENACLLSTYASVILVLVVVQCVGAYLAFRYRTDIKEEVNKGIRKEFDKFRDNNDFKKVIQTIQKQFECCGVTKPDDPLWEPNKVAASCCGQPFDNVSATCSIDQIVFHDGCVTTIENKVTTALGGLGGLAIGLVLVQLLIIISACCLAREVR